MHSFGGFICVGCQSMSRSGVFVSGDSNQSWLEMGYAPPIGYGLQHQGSGVSQHGLLTNQGLVNSQQVLGNVYQEPGNGPQGLVSGSQGLVNGPHGLVNSTAKSNVGIRHQRQTDNPFVDERWPFTPMAAEPNNGGHTPYGNGYYEHLPFDNRATSAVGPLARMGSSLSHQGSAGLIRFGSGDQYAQGTLVPPGSLADGFGAGMVRQASSPAPGMPFFLHGMAMPWGNPSLGQQLAPAKTAADSAAAANSLVMHGPHSLLERPGPGEPANALLPTGINTPPVVQLKLGVIAAVLIHVGNLGQLSTHHASASTIKHLQM